jgi:hypothetical protein
VGFFIITEVDKDKDAEEITIRSQLTTTGITFVSCGAEYEVTINFK